MDQNFATALTRVFRDDEAPPLPRGEGVADAAGGEGVAEVNFKRRGGRRTRPMARR